MAMNKLDPGELFIVKWQYGLHGEFEATLARLMVAADNFNLKRLKKSYPVEVEAFMKYKNEAGWWAGVKAKLKLNPAFGSL